MKWFHSYVSDRNQFLSINGYDSTKIEISCGVPHGSVPGPLLFLIFINDLPNMSNKIKTYLFADSTNIYVESETIGELVQIVNKELELVKKWIDANFLSLNISLGS